MYIRIAFFIELRLRVSHSLRSLANHPSSKTLISTEQLGGVRNWRASEASETLSGVTQSRFRYIYLFICLFIDTVRRTTFSARACNRKEGGVKFQSFLKQ